MASAVKILLAGDVNGKIEALFKRVETVNASNGPFSALICVGSFFGAGGDDAQHPGELLPYINGSKSAPMPTYFIGGFGLGSKNSIQALKTAESSNIHYLGRQGVATIHGLAIAFLDGIYNAAAYKELPEEDTHSGCHYYHEADVAVLKHRLASEGDIDFLLTNEWPAGVLAGLTEAAKPKATTEASSFDGTAICTDIVMTARPRYHIAAGKQTFYARAPYMNTDLGAGSHATRFISLGDVGNQTKQKWLHALAVTPASTMEPETLLAVPQGSTASPYNVHINQARKREAEAAEEGMGEQSWRWQQNKKQRVPIAAPSLGRTDIVKDRSKTIFVRNVPFRASEDDIVAFFSQAGKVVDVVRRANAEGKLNTYCHIQFFTEAEMEQACKLNGTELMGRELYIEPASAGEQRQVAKPVEGCWFCLSNPNADVELVVSIGEECYVASDKGAITDNHVLILPVEHYASSMALPASTYSEMERYVSALRTCFAAQGKQLVAFERYMKLRKSGGNHCHWNVMAVPASITAAKAQQVFESVAARHGFTLEHIPSSSTPEETKQALKDVVKDGEYFTALLPDGSRLVHVIAYGERHPLSYGREVLAELAGVPDRADWKNCETSKEAGIARTDRFKAAFEKYDIMNDAS